MVTTITGGSFDLSLRLDPESISWSYDLNTSKTDTYGGHVIQILSVNVNSLQLVVSSGMGGIAYQRRVVTWFRDTSIKLRESGGYCTFSYPPRNIRLYVIPRAISMGDALTDVRKDFIISFDVVEDLNGEIKKSIISDELSRLASGIGYTSNIYNNPDLSQAPSDVRNRLIEATEQATEQ